LKQLHRRFERAYVEHFVRPQLDSLGQDYQIMKPWNLRMHGARISLGESPHVVTERDRPVILTTWAYADFQGSINVGDFCLLCPGVRIDSASNVTVGNNSMVAAGVYITDADWHDIYDRSKPIGRTVPVVLGDNVWVGDSSIVCKGVQIGDNSVIGAGSVVTGDIPANVIAAGNPAKVIRPLDPEIPLRRRQDLLADIPKLYQDIDVLDRYLHSGNSWWGWLKSILKPQRGD
jgi:acetyltransferase-like isoleucine patch superfamily enzyme